LYHSSPLRKFYSTQACSGKLAATFSVFCEEVYATGRASGVRQADLHSSLNVEPEAAANFGIDACDLPLNDQIIGPQAT
jgi:hypothetical protein